MRCSDAGVKVLVLRSDRSAAFIGRQCLGVVPGQPGLPVKRLDDFCRNALQTQPQRLAGSESLATCCPDRAFHVLVKGPVHCPMPTCHILDAVELCRLPEYEQIAVGFGSFHTLLKECCLAVHRRRSDCTFNTVVVRTDAVIAEEGSELLSVVEPEDNSLADAASLTGKLRAAIVFKA